MRLVLAFYLAIGLTMSVSAKVKENPFNVKSISRNKVTYSYEYRHDVDDFQVVISATKNVGNGKIQKLWSTMLYRGNYTNMLSSDSQKTELKSFKFKDDILEAVDKRNTVYKVDPTSGAILSPKEPVVYKNE